MDTSMDTSEQSHDGNGATENGFMDPRVLCRAEDLKLLDLPQAESRNKSQSSPPDTKVVIRRANLPTGCCYDDRMKLHANADFSANPHHPEDPRRIEAIMTEFKDNGLVCTGTTLEQEATVRISPNQYMWRIPARQATREEICTAHAAGHYEWVRSLGDKTSMELRHMTEEFDNGRKSLYVGNLTYEAALVSAGAAIETCKNVVEGKVKNAIAVIRPPGHHAEHNESMGFCIFNNVPIAAKVCMRDYPEKCRKVLILDWDVHHGNGIQNMFYDNPNVLYVSLHVYKNGEFYPGPPEDDEMPDGGLGMCGVGAGLGMNVNIGWAEQGVGDGEYMAAFQKIVMPIAQEFDPDLVIISAGFDAAAGDELGGCWVSPPCYAHMTHMLMSLADGRVAVCLEGGYNLRAISVSALAVAKTLMGEPPQRMTIPPLNKVAAHTLDNVKRIQAAYWECMRPGVVPLSALKDIGTSRLSEIIRTAQKSDLAEQHDMIPLYVQRTKLSRSFENQVLVTPELNKAKKILLIIHDPEVIPPRTRKKTLSNPHSRPEIHAQPDPHDNTVDAHNTFVTDALLPYIKWAIEHGFGVIDINIPQHIFFEADSDPYAARPTEGIIAQQTRELLCYLWDNYIELNPNASLTLLGVGDAYFGIKQLLISRDAKDRIAGILCFVVSSLRPVKSETDQNLSRWYRDHSLIYVSPDHACWSDEESSRKVRKQRFGNVVMAEINISRGEVDGSGLGKMLRSHQDDSLRFIKRSVRQWDEEHVEQDETDEETLAPGADTVMDDAVAATGLELPPSVSTPVGT